jgi:hypothetical protein
VGPPATARLSEDDLAALSLATLTFGAPPEALSFLHVLCYIQAAGGVYRLDATEGDALVEDPQKAPLGGLFTK